MSNYNSKIKSVARAVVSMALLGNPNSSLAMHRPTGAELVANCKVQLGAIAERALSIFDWIFGSERPVSSQLVAEWAKGVGADENLVHIQDSKTGLSTDAKFFVPNTDPETLHRYQADVVPKTIGFMMTKDWYVEKDAAPFHVYVRVGNRVFRIDRDHNIVAQSYAETLQGLLARDGMNGPLPETREMVFSVSEPAKKALLEYFEGRLLGKVRGNAISTRYDVGAVGPETYDDAEQKQKVEMCVTFALSCIEPRFVELIPDLAQFQKDANFYAPSLARGSTPTAKQIMGYLTFTAKTDAVVLWARGAQQKVRNAGQDSAALNEIYRNFLATMGGKKIEISVLPQSLD